MNAEDLHAWVEQELRRMRVPGKGHLEDLQEVSVNPVGAIAACAAIRRDNPQATSRHLALIDLVSGGLSLVDLPHDLVGRPRFSPGGSDLLVILDDPDRGPTAVIVPATVTPGPGKTCPADGAAEDARWSPDGLRAGVLTAQAGAEISDVYGSGTVRVDAEDCWRPRVSPGGSGRRSLLIWDVVSGVAQTVTSMNVWEFDWLGQDSVIVLASEGEGEGAWYTAGLWRINLLTTVATPLLTELATQFAQPHANHGGTRWSVLAGVASDRGLLAGDLWVQDDGRDPQVIDTAGAHVTDHTWINADQVLFTGLDGLDLVVGVNDVPHDRARVLWRGPLASGRYQPQLGGVGAGGDVVVVLEGHAQPPTLGRIVDGEFNPVVDTAGPGTAYVVSRTGRTERVSWNSSDGTEIQGLLTTPATPGPHALVVQVHGGPIAAWQDGWIGRDVYTSLLVSRGYAVLRPNPRGSTGRGATFAGAVVGDMGGLDADDLTSGVQDLISRGVVDPERVGITGNSYGGFMSSWLPTTSDMFAASVARSPITDWVVLHFTCNLAEFDAAMLEGDPIDPGSQYRTRSPFTYYDRISTPILFTAGSKDLATPASQAQLLHGALFERDIDTALAVYPEEGHGVHGSQALVDQCARMLQWFDRYMPPVRPGPVEGLVSRSATNSLGFTE